MSNGSNPKALIVGMENFVAAKLAGNLMEKNLEVVGVGSGEGKSVAGVDYRYSLSEVEERVDYLFDFSGEEEVWEKAKTDGAKLTVVKMGGKAEVGRIVDSQVNWRMVKVVGAYGPGMGDEGWLAEALMLAAENKNLILPAPETRVRLISAEDAVEAILRASFLSSTEGKTFLVTGEEISVREVAEVLVEEAKMTRLKVLEKDRKMEKYTKEEVEQSWVELRWRPAVIFSEGVKETLQYFFTKLDERNRQKIEPKREEKRQVRLSEEEKKRLFEVIVEDEAEKVEKKEELEQEPKAEEVTEREDEEVVEEREEVEDKKIEEKKENMFDIEKFSLKRPPRPAEEGFEVEEREEEIVKKENNLSEVREEIVKKEKLGQGWVKWAVWGAISAMVISFVARPVGAVWAGWKAKGEIEKAGELIRAGKYDEAEEVISRGEARVDKWEERISKAGWNRVEAIRNYQEILRVEEGVLVLGRKGVELARLGEKINGAVLGGEEIDWENTLADLREGLVEMETEMGVLEARLKGDWSWLPGRFRTWPQKGVEQLERAAELAAAGEKLVDVMPEILGTDGKRREYLVLLQNEMELRPGGGFIGSYAVLAFEGGRLITFDVKDVYEADGQLKGHVEPPAELKKHLGEAGWYMRDANWQASFPAAAADIRWFMEKETGRKVDGVIGVNLAVAKKMLAVIGGVEVPDFGETVTEENLYEQAEYYAETKFFPGSVQKASFLGAVGNQLFEEVKILDTEGRWKMVEGMLDLLERNEIQIALIDEKAAAKLAEAGWDGAMYEGKCGGENCLADYLYIVEANVGVNKANYFVYRKVEEVVDISERAVSRSVKINLENSAKSQNWPGGDYKSYIRVYVPMDINLAEVSIWDGERLETRKVYSGDELSIKTVGKRKEIGFLAVVPINSKRIIELKYSSSVDLTSMDSFSYINYIQKQSGYGDTGWVSLISMPEGWQPMRAQPAVALVNGKLLFNMKLDKDIKMGVEISK